jgi:hypothetical protein
MILGRFITKNRKRNPPNNQVEPTGWDSPVKKGCRGSELVLVSEVFQARQPAAHLGRWAAEGMK